MRIRIPLMLHEVVLFVLVVACLYFSTTISGHGKARFEELGLAARTGDTVTVDLDTLYLRYGHGLTFGMVPYPITGTRSCPPEVASEPWGTWTLAGEATVGQHRLVVDVASSETAGCTFRILVPHAWWGASIAWRQDAPSREARAAEGRRAREAEAVQAVREAASVTPR